MCFQHEGEYIRSQGWPLRTFGGERFLVHLNGFNFQMLTRAFLILAFGLCLSAWSSVDGAEADVKSGGS
jgi:hypothetical protein